MVKKVGGLVMLVKQPQLFEKEVVLLKFGQSSHHPFTDAVHPGLKAEREPETP